MHQKKCNVHTARLKFVPDDAYICVMALFVHVHCSIILLAKCRASKSGRSCLQRFAGVPSRCSIALSLVFSHPTPLSVCDTPFQQTALSFFFALPHQSTLPECLPQHLISQQQQRSNKNPHPHNNNFVHNINIPFQC